MAGCFGIHHCNALACTISDPLYSRIRDLTFSTLATLQLLPLVVDQLSVVKCYTSNLNIFLGILQEEEEDNEEEDKRSSKKRQRFNLIDDEAQDDDDEEVRSSIT